jgi:hypothetical protein
VFYCNYKSNIYNHEHLWPWGSGFFLIFDKWMIFICQNVPQSVSCECYGSSASLTWIYKWFQLLLQLWYTIIEALSYNPWVSKRVSGDIYASHKPFEFSLERVLVLSINTEQHARYLVPGLRRCSLEGQVSIVELNGTWMLQPFFFKIWDMLAVLAK